MKNISHLIDFERVNTLLEGFNQTTGFVTAILDLEGNILSKSGWREICTHFHRINPETAKKCRSSDTDLANKMAEGEKFRFYQCLNGLVDVAVPIVINGMHLANLFSGQFFFEEPDPLFFKEQAKRYGFDEKKYLEALKKVPIVSKEKVETTMAFLQNMTLLISETAFQKLEQEELNKALRESEFQYRNLANTGLALIWTSGVDKLCNYFNDPWLKFTGRTLTQEMGNGWTEGVHPDDFDRCLETYVTAFDKREPFEMEYRLRHASGEYRFILDMGSPNFNSKGEFMGYIGHCFDITERKMAESEKEKLQIQLTQAHKMESVGRLAGGVAHDFNNMLGVILGHIEMALEGVDPEQPLYDDLLEVRKAAERSAELTRQLLTFARKQAVAPKVIDLNEAVEGMLKMLRRLIGEDIDLNWKPGRNLQPVKIDPAQIDQLLANLCVNARDAIAGVGKITIKTEVTSLDEAFCVGHPGFEPGDYVMLGVTDNGCGMDQETIDHLFEPFFTTKEMGKGTGLGLASVYGIVKQNNGFIDVLSAPGQGTSFYVYLPRIAVKSDHLPEKGLVPQTEHGCETIMLVEDEPAILKMTTIMLKRLGYTVLATSKPGEAIRLAHEYPERIDLLITDVVMPEMNGRDLACALLSFHPGLKRLFMSGYTANVIAHHGVLDEGVHFIQKPFSRKDLAAKVRQTLKPVDEDVY
jgi:PAS domain S-box-containing protein